MTSLDFEIEQLHQMETRIQNNESGKQAQNVLLHLSKARIELEIIREKRRTAVIDLSEIRNVLQNALETLPHQFKPKDTY